MKRFLICLCLGLSPSCVFDYFEASLGAARSDGQILRGGNGSTPIANSEGNSVFGWLTGGILLDKGKRSGTLEREAREARVDAALERRDVREVVRDELENVLDGASDRMTAAAPASSAVPDKPIRPEAMPAWLSAVYEELQAMKSIPPPEPAPGPGWIELGLSGIIGAATLIAGIKAGPAGAAAARAGGQWVRERFVPGSHGDPPDVV